MEHGTQTGGERKRIPYFRLGVQSLPEMWTHHLAGGPVISSALVILHFLMRETAGTAEMIEAVDAVAAGEGPWNFSIALFFYFLTVVATLIVEFFPHILLSDRILRGEPANPWHEMWESAKALKRFRSPLGVVILIYISVFLPLIYLGISMLL